MLKIAHESESPKHASQWGREYLACRRCRAAQMRSGSGSYAGRPWSGTGTPSMSRSVPQRRSRPRQQRSRRRRPFGRMIRYRKSESAGPLRGCLRRSGAMNGGWAHENTQQSPGASEAGHWVSSVLPPRGPANTSSVMQSSRDRTRVLHSAQHSGSMQATVCIPAQRPWQHSSSA